MRPSAAVRVARRACAAGVCATALAAATTTGAQAAGGRADPGLPGWWYDALVVKEAHEETTGEGATVIMADGAIDTGVPELRGADLTLREDCAGEPTVPDTRSEAQHGTTMAALVVGTGRGNGPGGRGVAGIAPGAHLDYHSLDTSDGPGIGCEDGILPHLAESVRRAGSGPIVSWSLGGMALGYREAQRDVERAGGVWVAAAGDRFDAGTRGQIDLPAGLPGFVAVLALDADARPADLNPGRTVIDGVELGYPTISAPGVDIPGVQWAGGSWRSGVPQTGTSHATAIVAGALALVKSKYPEATGNQLIQHLIHFDTDPESFTWSEDRGFGVVSLRSMLAHDPTGWPDVNPLRVDDPDHPSGIRQPEQVLEAFPMSLHDPERDEVGDTADEDVAPAAAGDVAGDGAGVPPTLAWVGGGLAAVALLGGAAALARRTRTSE